MGGKPSKAETTVNNLTEAISNQALSAIAKDYLTDTSIQTLDISCATDTKKLPGCIQGALNTCASKKTSQADCVDAIRTECGLLECGANNITMVGELDVDTLTSNIAKVQESVKNNIKNNINVIAQQASSEVILPSDSTAVINNNIQTIQDETAKIVSEVSKDASLVQNIQMVGGRSRGVISMNDFTRVLQDSVSKSSVLQKALTDISNSLSASAITSDASKRLFQAIIFGMLGVFLVLFTAIWLLKKFGKTRIAAKQLN